MRRMVKIMRMTTGRVRSGSSLKQNCKKCKRRLLKRLKLKWKKKKKEMSFLCKMVKMVRKTKVMKTKQKSRSLSKKKTSTCCQKPWISMKSIN